MGFGAAPDWSVTVDDADRQLLAALWFRAAERIGLAAEDVVTGPPEVDPVPQPSVPSGEPLAEGWRYWWRSLLAQRSDPPVGLADLGTRRRYSPPDFDGLADYPALRRVAVARWDEAAVSAAEQHRAITRAGLESTDRRRHLHREGAAVRAVEREISRQATPFHLRIIVLPVLDEAIRPVGNHTYLVPRRVRASSAYDTWLDGLFRVLA